MKIGVGVSIYFSVVVSPLSGAARQQIVRRSESSLPISREITQAPIYLRILTPGI